jgi:hypothetical protein
MATLEARNDFLMRNLLPALGFAKPLPAVLGVKHRALPAQSFHIATACQLVHRDLPARIFSAPYARRRDGRIKSV